MNRIISQAGNRIAAETLDRNSEDPTLEDFVFDWTATEWARKK